MYGGINGGSTGNMLNASIVLDDGSPVMFSPPAQSNATYNMEYFSSSGLTQGNHTLTVTSENDEPIFLDYILVIPGNLTLKSPSTQSSTSTTKTVVSSSTTSFPASSSPASSPTQVPSKSIAPIIGGAVGGVLVFVFVICIAVLRLRKTRQLRKTPVDRRRYMRIIPNPLIFTNSFAPPTALTPYLTGGPNSRTPLRSGKLGRVEFELALDAPIHNVADSAGPSDVAQTTLNRAASPPPNYTS